jgi:hypothetical protein
MQMQIERLELLANEAELLANLACDPDMREQNKRRALELREAAVRVRSRQELAA